METWAGVGHFPHLEAPDRTNAALREFLGLGVG
jgi:pimeloyl-ACP methyl ester carboxylesterase